MRAILKSTGERGFAYQNECDMYWYFISFPYYNDKRVLRSDLVLIPEEGANV